MSKTANRDWYDTPLYYDIIFDADSAKEADFMEAMMRRHSGVKSQGPWRVLEPACGTGRLLLELAQRGHEVSGFDANPNMLEYARQRLAKKKCRAELWQDRLESFSPPSRKQFDLAHCLVSTFKYIQDEDGALSHLSRVAASLRRGGLYLLGLHLTDYGCTSGDHERWKEERDGIRVVCNTRTWPADREARRERLRTRLKITRDGETWAQETRWTFRTYNAAQLRSLVKKAPALELAACHTFDYDPNETCKLDRAYAAVLVLRKT
jgi:SAM-dependent methyltransferase